MHSRRRLSSNRHAAVTLEMIIALPIFLIFLAGIIEFGLIQANSQQVALASRIGARLAAETAGLSPATTAATATSIRTEIDRQLQSAKLGASASQGVTLRHTVLGGAVATDGTCPDPTTPAMPTNAVRVTVSVPLSSLTPNLLNVFGYTTAGKTVEVTTTYAYEL